MTSTKAAWLAWALCALGLLLALAEPLLALRAAGGALPAADLEQSVPSGLIAIVFGLVGALIVSRQPRQTIGWLVLIIAPCYAAGDLLNQWGARLPAATPLTPLIVLLVWLGGVSWWLLVGPLLLILLLFPTGRLVSARWRWVVAALGASLAAFLIDAVFAADLPLPFISEPVRNPLAFVPDGAAQLLTLIFQALLAGAAISSVAAIFIRYRRAGALERQQLKWFFYAGALFGAVFILQFFINSDTSQTSNTADWAGVLFILAILAMPLAIGVAILRYRLWDIDVIIRRTLVYAALTGLLALAYFGSVLVLQNIFSALTGQSQSALVTVLSTLVLAALFVPLRRRVQSVIDQRFYRRKYDAARTLAVFATTLRDETNLDQLSAHLTDVVDETMRPSQVDLWLRTNLSGTVQGHESH